jgi:hypothetical protein
MRHRRSIQASFAAWSISRAALPAVAVAGLLPTLVACDDSTKRSEQAAVATLAQVSPLIDKDMAAIREGLPDGAKLLATELPTDASSDLKGTQEAIKRTREHTDKLRLAKSTFFVLTSPDGVVIRSENDPDRLVDKNVFTAFPDLKKAADPKSDVVEAFGQMDEMRGVKKGDDMEWVLSAPVVGKDGKLRGTFTSGWSFRLYAYYLEQQAKRYLDDQAKTSSDHKIPVMYVYIVKGPKAYGAPDTPDPNAEAVGKLDLGSKVKSGSYKTHADITGRVFGVAADPAKGLGDDAAIVVVTSVY